ncbi:ABC transporter ATP-binding protein [Bacillus coahuilensis p1.1.43]|uniref:ABC transporter ATP-binding protein n=1 Tax=Bacillus coahuilensis p1.1.43 TaxID=1150625 RepID=A0A147KBR6_9BACI|nr:ABC transporter permease [Bacillus coahuilensis]KUP08735.1 ABC transporter ATP-binding protein [Bacillus coahuilensis p1.1.43]
MRKLWSVCLFEIQRLVKKPQSYILMFAMPLLFTLIFGSLFGKQESVVKADILIVDEDQSELSHSMIHHLQQSSVFHTLEVASDTKGTLLIKEKEADGMLVIQKGFQQTIINGEDPTISFVYHPELVDTTAISNLLNDMVTSTQIKGIGSQKWSEITAQDWSVLFASLSIDENGLSESLIEKTTITKSEDSKNIQNMPARAAGFTIMFVMIVMISVTGTMLEAKQNGVWYRLMSTPISRVQLLGGYLLSFFLIGWIQFAVLMIATHLLFGVVWGDPLGLIVLVSAVLVCVVGLGLFIAGLSKTVEQQSSIGNIVIISTCMLGGVYWPLEIVPDFMKTLSEFVPQTWAMKGFEELIARGGGPFDIVLPVAVLLLFATLFLSIGLTRIKYE